MIFELNLDLGFNMEQDWSLQFKIKSDVILSFIDKLNEDMSSKYNCIIIPVSIYNIIEHHVDFINNWKVIDTLVRVGYIHNFECCLDMNLPSNEMIISWNTEGFREIKINNLLNNIELGPKQIKIIS